MNTVIVVFCTGIVIWLSEQWRPAHSLPQTQAWYRRALLLNTLQGASAVITTGTVDVWFANASLISISSLPVSLQVGFAYLVITFIYYWWHRARHQIGPLWRWLHQTHHSPARLEVIMSFYKHPLEVLLNGALSSVIVFYLLGVTTEAAVIAVMMTGLAELFYHMNISTPHWFGYFFQRPEMHRVHHQRCWHHENFSDLPLWDMLFGTFNNPVESPPQVGFPDSGEIRLVDLLLGKRVPS